MSALSEGLDLIAAHAVWLLAVVFVVTYFFVSRRLRQIEYVLAVLVGSSEPSGSLFVGTKHWDEKLYLAVNPDVAAAVANKRFVSGRAHFELAGRAEHRKGGWVPPGWNEEGYLEANPDVACAVFEERFLSGYHHYLVAGAAEKRRGGFPE